MKRLGILLGCAALILGGRATRADEESEAPPGGAPTIEGTCACEGPGPANCGAKHRRDGHFVRWLTYHPTRTPHGVCSHHPSECCTPPLYVYFLGECEKSWPRIESCEPTHAAPACPTCGGHP
jgi:hypothetical protein